jgi:hypothetical protein
MATSRYIDAVRGQPPVLLHGYPQQSHVIYVRAVGDPAEMIDIMRVLHAKHLHDEPQETPCPPRQEEPLREQYRGCVGDSRPVGFQR